MNVRKIMLINVLNFIYIDFVMIQCKITAC